VLAAVTGGARVLTYSAQGAAADVRVEDVRFHTNGVDARLHTPWGSGSFTSPLPGEFNLANLAAAVTAVVLSGAELSSVLAAVAGLRPVPGRMQAIPNESGLQVLVDYAHTPDALEQVLKSLRAHVAGRLITVFGCGGDRDRAKRQVMGRVASQYSDRVVVTSDNPRSEDPAAILADIATGCSGNFILLVDRAEAIDRAVAEANPGDCVVIAGKGHEDYQLIEGEHRHFSDAQQAAAALARRAAR
jgi:UDP-N-acetylmuramoyl-L-alanyl-D-glutamate--2,6-diaminopimelate ligase